MPSRSEDSTPIRARRIAASSRLRPPRSQLATSSDFGGHSGTLAQPSVYRPEVSDPTFATPEEAAVADFPSKYVRVESVTYSRDGERAKVALLTNEEPYLYP